MANIILSAFSDEFSSDFDAQIAALNKFGIPLMEIRGVSGTNVGDLTECQAKEAAEKLRAGGIGLSAIGSPIGKIKITDPMDEHIEKLKRVINTAHILGTDRIRMFSFYMPGETTDYSPYKNEVIDRLGMMLDVADKENIYLCHENEKGIYGDTPGNCLEILNAFDGRLKCVFDPANFVQRHVEVYPHAFSMLEDKLFYLHIKDADETGEICAAGEGIGCIKDVLRAANKRDGDLVVTLEPHLWEFSGLAGLEAGEKTQITNKYPDAETAFAAGVEALRKCIDEIR